MSAYGRTVQRQRLRRRKLRDKARALYGKPETRWVSEYQDRLVRYERIADRTHGADKRTDTVVIDGVRITFWRWAVLCAQAIPIAGPRGVLP